MGKWTKALAEFLDESPSSYHAVDNVRKMLEGAGYVCLSPREKWDLSPGGKYYTIRNGSAILAFRVPMGQIRGFMMGASHSDRPAFKVKESPELETAGAYLRLAVEKYGGMLMAPWLDRPLSVAGRVLVETEGGVESRLVNLGRDLLMIPNVAIHMNRKANEGYAYNPAVDMLPLMGSLSCKGALRALLAEAAGLSEGAILGHDLYLYLRQKAAVWGMKEEYISAQGLDDLQCVFASVTGFLLAQEGKSIPLCCVFDNEEVGSNTRQGADSDLLKGTLERICKALGLDPAQMAAGSFMVSADNAHALHPNHPEYADQSHRPVMNGGIVLKFNANQRYTTDGTSAALFRKICSRAGVPVQTFCNRADLPGGSTLGNISNTQVSVPTVDVGLPQLAMHSCYETAGTEDTDHLVKAMKVMYETSLLPDGRGGYRLEFC